VKVTTHLYLAPRLRIHRSIPPLPYAFTVWCSVKHRDNFTLNYLTYGMVTGCRKILIMVILLSAYFINSSPLGPFSNVYKTLPYRALRKARNSLYDMYPKASGLAAWSENYKWYSSLPLGAVISLLCESV
jgi:hypothetical protein